jgi:hypothetical protein
LRKIKELIEDRMADTLTLGHMVNENPCFRVLNEAGIWLYWKVVSFPNTKKFGLRISGVM